MVLERVLLATLMVVGVGACGGDTNDARTDIVQVDGGDTLSNEALCRAVPNPCDDEGARECRLGGTRTCVEVGGCLQWGFVTSCEPGTVCAFGECAPSCGAQACDIAGARRCAPTAAAGIERCDDFDADGCLEWGADGSCSGDEVCVAGGVCGDACLDECAVGFQKCEGTSIVTCADHDADGCTEWGAPAACADQCAAGSCVEGCVDECGADGLAACDGLGVKICRADGDGCLRWGTTTPCGQGTTCSAGTCTETCADECSTVGARTCDGLGAKTCGQYDADPCRDWSPVTACAAGATCSDGQCAAGCVNECTTTGARDCDDDGLGVLLCGQADADTCLEWTRVGQCDASAGETCSQGTCGVGCLDACSEGEARCRAGSATRVEVCGDGDADPCLEWVAGDDCAADGLVCADGACAATCQDDCDTDGVSVCDGDAVVPCGQYDADACLDAGTPSFCQPWERCDAGACAATPPPATGVISEVLYDAVGVDHDVFVELRMPPGTALDGFTLEAINGANDDVYARIALTGTVDASGLWVVAHPQASPALRAVADQLAAAVDLQNGPDSVRIVWGEVVVDALAYGVFGATDHPHGEGTPASGAPAGASLARDAAGTDTDDNAADFRVELSATPGGLPLVPVRPTGAHQVIVTEVMADPTVLTDAAGEWFELHNRSATASYDLDGCVLYDDDGDEHVISGPLVIEPSRFAALARGPSPGFSPAYVYGQLNLSNNGDEIYLKCGDVLIDAVGWTERWDEGRSLSLEPAGYDAVGAGADEHWCLSTGSYNGDKGTPGLPNPPCPTSGTYEQVALADGEGVCNLSSNWNEFSFTETQSAAADATLDFEWLVAKCASFQGAGQLFVELRKSGTWTEVASATIASAADSCEWHTGSATVAKTTINASRTPSGVIDGRFRVVSGCSYGVGCGLLGSTLAPTNCARKLTLTYAH